MNTIKTLYASAVDLLAVLLGTLVITFGFALFWLIGGKAWRDWVTGRDMEKD
jgi:hypothetical protein